MAFCLSLSGCYLGSGVERFNRQMDQDVGKRAEDPYIVRNLYPERKTASRELPNGNLEEEFFFGGRCRVHVEIDKAKHVISSWRRNPIDNDCWTAP